MRKIPFLIVALVVLSRFYVANSQGIDQRCDNAHFDFPVHVLAGERYDAHFYITNNSDTDVRWDVEFQSNMGNFNPQGLNNVLGISGVEMSYGVVIYDVPVQTYGYFTAVVKIDGEDEVCAYANHKFLVTSPVDSDIVRKKTTYSIK